MDPELQKSVEELVATNKRLIRLQDTWRYFMRGVISGIGATVGAALAIALFAGLLHRLSGFDVFRPFVQQVLPYIEQQSRAIAPETAFPEPSYMFTPSPDFSPTSSPGVESPSPTATEETT